ncbi:unnamed protein product [Cochlearia groenlandica]
MASSSSSARNWAYDVFPSFSGEDIRVTFLSHFLKEFDRKLIIAFKDSEIKKSHSLWPELVQAIEDSRISIALFSKNYASSSWCLNELLEIMKCKKEFGQMVIPVFYGLDPSHVRKQTGDFGKIFKETCLDKTEDVKAQWKEALTDVANILGYHSVTWINEAKMIENIANDVLDKLLLTKSKDYEDFVGMEDHMAKLSKLLQMECEEVRMIGIWGSSGIGKTIIARTLFSRLKRHFQISVFIDRSFISKNKDLYSRNNTDDYNMKLNMQRNFLSEILDKKSIKIDHLGVVGERLKYHRVLIFIDDLDDQVVLDALAGHAQWFGSGSRIVAITKDMHILRAHGGINHIYEVRLPSEKLALEILCRSAFGKNYPPPPPHGFMELALEVVDRVDSLPLALNVLGMCLRRKDEEYWRGILSRLQNGIDGSIYRTLRVGYDGLDNKKDEALFRHIACFFNYEGISYIKQMVGDSELDVNIGLENLSDKSLIHIRRHSVVMHYLLQEMGKEVVRAKSKELGEREFLIDSEDICQVLEENIGTRNVLGISLNIDEIVDELNIHYNAFKGMRNLRFLNIYTKQWNGRKVDKLHLLESFEFLPPKLRLLSWDRFPMRYMPCKFVPKYLVEIKMEGSKLEKLWEGIGPLTCLNYMDMSGSENLKEIPDLSLATNLKTLYLSGCLSLVDLPLSIRNLNKLKTLVLSGCINLLSLPSGINLQSLCRLDLSQCSKLNAFPDISTNISYLVLDDTSIKEIPCDIRLRNLVILSMKGIMSDRFWEGVKPLTPLMMTMLSPSLKSLYLSHIESLVELPSSFQDLSNLERLRITQCINLKTLPSEINLQSLDHLDFDGCSLLKSFPDISTNISTLYLSNTGIEEVPIWIKKFTNLRFLHMRKCLKLKCVSLNIFKLKHLEKADFTLSRMHSNEASFRDSQNIMFIDEGSIQLQKTVPEEASSSLPADPKLCVNFVNCFLSGHDALLKHIWFLKGLIFPGEEVPLYFTYRTSGTSLINIPLLQVSPIQPFFRVRACAVVEIDSSLYLLSPYLVIQICCRFKDKLGNIFISFGQPHSFRAYHQKGSHVFIFDCRFSLNKDNVPLGEVDIEFHIIEDRSLYILKGCGIQIFDENLSSPNNRQDNVSYKLGQSEWTLPSRDKGDIFKHLTLALKGAKQQFLKGRLRGE